MQNYCETLTKTLQNYGLNHHIIPPTLFISCYNTHIVTTKRETIFGMKQAGKHVGIIHSEAQHADGVPLDLDKSGLEIEVIDESYLQEISLAADRLTNILGEDVTVY
ncbi:MAG: hypothetical protein MAG795_00886 [Candidatus Woesearchaeota archaeon]|nr:hypothetical protein [Candidatus Woesearchaeota archaeon]